MSRFTIAVFFARPDGPKPGPWDAFAYAYPTVILVDGETVVGGWLNQKLDVQNGSLGAATIAAEVLKAVNLDARMIFGPSGSQDHARKWWESVKTVSMPLGPLPE